MSATTLAGAGLPEAGSPAPGTADAALPGTWRVAHPSDPAVRVLLEDLVREYTLRYGTALGGSPRGARAEIERYPEHRFVAPEGAFVVYEEAGEVLAGGAIMALNAHTAEVKRVWTRADTRGRGLGRATMAHLEARALQLGYANLFLTTGPAQPEAVALYLGTGYTPGFDPAEYPVQPGPHPFSKALKPLSSRGLSAGEPIDPGAVAATPASPKEQIA